MWFIGVEVEQETSAPPPKKNPGSAPVYDSICPPIEQVTHKEQQTAVPVGGDALINVIGTGA